MGKGKGKYGIGVDNDTPAVNQMFTVEGRNFRDADPDSVQAQVAFGIGHGFKFFNGTPAGGAHKIAIECALPAFDPVTGRDLSEGAEGVVYEYVRIGESVHPIERGSVLVFVGQ